MRVVASICALLLCQPWLAEPPKVNPVISVPGYVSVRLMQGYLLIVPGRIGRVEGLQFVLDTGATHSVINRELLSKLEISAPPRSYGSVLNFDKRVAVEAVQVKDLEIGPLQIPELTITVSDLGYFRSFAGRVDGIIGLDTLARCSFTIDFAARKVAFGASAGSLFESKGRASKEKTHFAHMRRERDYFSVELETEGRPLELAVDTGVREIVLYQDHLTNHGVDYRVIDRAFGIGLGGVLRSNIAIVDRLSISGQGLAPHVVLTAAPAESGHPRLDGFFGLASLRARRVSFDFEHEVLSWSN